VHREREKLKKTIVKLEDEKGKLLSTISELHDGLRYLTHRLNNMTRPVKVPNYGYDIMDDMILHEEKISKFKGGGSDSKSANEQGESSKDTHASQRSRTKVTMFNNMSKHPANLISISQLCD
jgi:hypothetical protein